MGLAERMIRTPVALGMMRCLAACLALAFAMSCGSTTELSEKTGEWSPPIFGSATEFFEITLEMPTLCIQGAGTIEFTRDGQMVGLVVPLNKDAVARLEVTGDSDLDTVLAVYGPEDETGYFGRNAVAKDDDSGEGRLSRLDGFTATQGGRYLVLVSTFGGTGRGRTELVLDVDGAPGCVALRKGLPDLDVLFVVDDSPSMATKQVALGRGARAFLDRLDLAGESDLRIAVTTTNVCPASKAGAIRGRFVYQPVTDLPAAGIVKRNIPCVSDADCQQRSDLPDAANWVCEARPLSDMWTCDRPGDDNAEAGEDAYPGDFLFTAASQCRYRCSREKDPMTCTELFGIGPRCRATCGDKNCSVADCASVGYPALRCQQVCETDDCMAFCETYLGSTQQCMTACSKVGQESCHATCAGEGTIGGGGQGLFPGRDFLCGVACAGATSCVGRCVAEFRDRDELPYRCEYPSSDQAMAGCLPDLAGPDCPPGVPTILTRGTAQAYADRWRAGEWRGLPSWESLDDIELERAVLARLFECQVLVGAAQTVCGNQEQGLRAAWLALDPAGENAAQASQFLRDDATLLVVVVSDEDDCSAPERERSAGIYENVVSPESYGRCACLRDEDGCVPGGGCNAAACLTDGEFDAGKCPLLQTARFVTGLRGLKADPSRVLFAAFSGAVVPGSTTSPSSDGGAIRQRYYDCKCDLAAQRTASYTYACQSDLGLADQGDRYADTVTGFGNQGWFGNLCEGVDLGGLAQFVRAATGADLVDE